MTDYFEVIRHLSPDAEFMLSDNDYSTLVWRSPQLTQPTKQECDAAWPVVQYVNSKTVVERQRRWAYAESADPLFFAWQHGDATEQEWLDAVQAVKDAHPYPEAP
jgi:hypothetical protein